MQTEKISVNLEQQSTLAKLLAQENIHVVHGNYRTAWFQPEQRVLALPIWKNRGKAVYDLLTGHEVGHALFTPARGWHDAVDEYDGAPRAYLNVLEDVRIERKIQDRYPGLRLQFQKGYKVLADEDFFGLSKTVHPISQFLLIDRINLQSKIGSIIDVPFNESEQPFLDAAYRTETFEDVVQLAKKIYAYQRKMIEEAKKKAKQNANKPKLSTQSKSVKPIQDDEDATAQVEDNTKVDILEAEEDNTSDYINEKDRDELAKESKSDNQDEVPEDIEALEDEEPEEKISSNIHAKTDDDTEKKELDRAASVEGPNNTVVKDDDLDMLESLTDQAFRQKEADLVAGKEELGNAMVYTMNEIKQSGIIIDYKEYIAQWKRDLTLLTDWRAELVQEGLRNVAEDYKKFKHDTEAAAAYMAKEFELRKAAYQYSRSSVHKTGVLNTNKLHSYKTSEDIFLRSTKLANYKNHGMMMFIDFSGSMTKNIGATIRQVLNLASFCRMVNIPYEVYAFTTRVRMQDEDEEQQLRDFMDSEVIPQKFNLLNLSSSRMSRKEYQESMNMLWHLSAAWDGRINTGYITPWNQLNSTPLNTCIVYAEKMVKQYKLKHSIERMTVMFLTDGESDSLQVRMTDEGDAHRVEGSDSYWRGRKAFIRVNGRTIAAPSINSADVTSELLKGLKTATNSTVLGFFISEYRNQAIGRVCDVRGYRKKDFYTDQMNKNRALIEDDIFGYDRYFGLCTKYMDVVEDEFDTLVEDGANKHKLKTAFSKLTKQKRVNRILLNAFVDAIA